MTNTVTDGAVVQIHYTLTLDDGTVVDSSKTGDPLAYLHGGGNIVPGLERQIGGKQVGDSFAAVVPAAEGYGEFDPDGEQTVPRSAFPQDADLQPGMQFLSEDGHGNVQPLWIRALQQEQVTITTNHPLAGQRLNFQIEVVGLRQATREELAHGHPHGPGGHHH